MAIKTIQNFAIPKKKQAFERAYRKRLLHFNPLYAL